MRNSRLIRIIQISFLFLLISTSSFSQSDPSNFNKYTLAADQITKKALTEKTGYKLLQELCDIGPRLSGSENSLRAIYWAEEKLKSFGVDKVWLQPVMVPHWERGSVETAVIVYDKNISEKSLSILSLGGSIATSENGITANVIEVKNFTELEKRKNEVKGKIVFFSRPVDEGLLNTFAGYGSAVDQRVYGAVEAAKYGAVAVLIRSITTKHDNVPHTGVMVYVDSLPKIPAAAIGYLDSDYLHNELTKDSNLKISLSMNCKTLPDAQSYNVIAEITGSEFPEEIIVVDVYKRQG